MTIFDTTISQVKQRWLLLPVCSLYSDINEHSCPNFTPAETTNKNCALHFKRYITLQNVENQQLTPNPTEIDKEKYL